MLIWPSIKKYLFLTLTLALLLTAFNIECKAINVLSEPNLSYVILVDTSASLRAQITDVIETSKTIVRLSKPEDEATIIRFVNKDKIETLQDFTNDKKALQKTLDTLYVEYGTTAIMDAVESAAKVLVKRQEKVSQNSRSLLILISDGDDRSSDYNRAEMVKRLNAMNVHLYCFGIVLGLEKQGKSNQDKAIKLLKEMAVGSGGQAFFPRTEEEVQAAANAILRDARK